MKDTTLVGRRYQRKKTVIADPFFWQFVNRFQEEVYDLHKISTYNSAKSVFRILNLEFGHKKLSQITSRDVQVFVTQLSKTSAPSTVRKYWSVLSSLLQYASAEGLMEEIRKPKLPRNRRPKQDWFTLPQLRELIERSNGPIHILIMLLAETGCRIGEALALQTRHLDVEKQQLRIEQNVYAGQIQTPKTESSYRTVALSAQLCYVLNELRVKSDPAMFVFRTKQSNPWTQGTAYYRINKLLERIGLPKYGEHAFRRGNITFLINILEMPERIVGQRVGHLSDGMTLGVYVQPQEGLDRKWIGKIAEALYGTENQS